MLSKAASSWSVKQAKKALFGIRRTVLERGEEARQKGGGGEGAAHNSHHHKRHAQGNGTRKVVVLVVWRVAAVALRFTRAKCVWGG